jgi:hypothetical protein
MKNGNSRYNIRRRTKRCQSAILVSPPRKKIKYKKRKSKKINGLDGLNSEKNVIKNSAMSNNILNKEGLESFKKFSLNENNNIDNSNNNSNSNEPGYQINEKGHQDLKKKKSLVKNQKKLLQQEKEKH